VLVTNGHVVPERLAVDDAVVVFHGLDGDAGQQPPFRIVRRWWYQPSQRPGLDTTLLELDGYPANVAPLPLAGRLPAITGTTQRAYLIGHPRGLTQPQFSLQDNLLLDYDDTLVHYRSPTEGGSSGSPVFDNQWKLIGLHHAGGFDTPRLHNRGGTYPANEAIALPAIRKALTVYPPVAQDVG
jgi:V8-like Glu-specific endopeptidase